MLLCNYCTLKIILRKRRLFADLHKYLKEKYNGKINLGNCGNSALWNCVFLPLFQQVVIWFHDRNTCCNCDLVEQQVEEDALSSCLDFGRQNVFDTGFIRRKGYSLTPTPDKIAKKARLNHGLF